MENKNAGRNIDTLCLQPGFVETKIVEKQIDRGEAYGVVSVAACVNGALRDLGYEEITSGPLKHELWTCFLSTLYRYKILPFKGIRCCRRR